MSYQDRVKALVASGSREDLELAELILASPYLQFEPRPDRPDIGDEMTSFITDDHPGKIVLGGTGSAKTYSTAWLFANMLYTHEPPEPNTAVWIIATTLDQVGMIWTQAISKFIDKSDIQPNGIRWRKSELEPEIVRMKPTARGNSWNIHFLSCEQGRKALQAATVWMIWGDEQMPQDIIEECWGRLRKWDHPNKFILTCTPLVPDNWLQELWDRRDEPEVSNLYRFYRLNSMCNEHSDPKWRRDYFASLSPDQRATRQFGDFANFRGAVFPEFTSDLIIGPGDAEYENIKDKLEGFEQFIGVDFGFHHPAAVWLARDKDTYYIIDEDQLTDAMPDQLAKRIKRRYDYRHTVFVDYEDIISARTLTASGIQNSPCAGKKVVHSILQMKDLFWQKKIKVFRGCVQTIRQLRGYRWKDFDENADKAEPNQIKPAVIKVKDHLVDCVKYVIWTATKRVVKPWGQIENRAVPIMGGGGGIPIILRPGQGGYDPQHRRFNKR